MGSDVDFLLQEYDLHQGNTAQITSLRSDYWEVEEPT